MDQSRGLITSQQSQRFKTIYTQYYWYSYYTKTQRLKKKFDTGPKFKKLVCNIKTTELQNKIPDVTYFHIKLRNINKKVTSNKIKQIET